MIQKISMIVALMLLLPSGAYAASPAVDDLTARVEALEALISDLQGQIDAIGPHSPDLTSDVAANATAIASIGPHFSGDHDDLTNVTSDQHHISEAASVADLEYLLANVSRGVDLYTGKDTLRLAGMNLQVVNGSGTTDGSPDGTGNVIIGYNKLGNGDGDARTGSHMLVIGEQNSYTSYGGMVVGFSNTASGGYASVSGGSENIASGVYSSVSGGYLNEASNYYSSASGGGGNIASGGYASVSGGANNEASGYISSISGGELNNASGNSASVNGGKINWADGSYSSISGGESNAAYGLASSVSGGAVKQAASPYCWEGDPTEDC